MLYCEMQFKVIKDKNYTQFVSMSMNKKILISCIFLFIYFFHISQ